ncbi:hypothetical protein CKA32_002007 [Geitlerinema sp. FC II]|nr:hypothetical protein CKA32_002007 [Geitlerinema sp. FC II]
MSVCSDVSVAVVPKGDRCDIVVSIGWRSNILFSIDRLLRYAKPRLD